MRCRMILCVGALALATGCSIFPSWHWERPGASDADYKFDETECKGRAYSGTDGAVTQESVRRMQACMLAKGWRKTPN